MGRDAAVIESGSVEGYRCGSVEGYRCGSGSVEARVQVWRWECEVGVWRGVYV